MKLTYLYHPVTDLDEGLAHFRDQLGWEEAWREGDDTVAFWTPDRSAQVMVARTDEPAGPMYLVDSVTEWLAAHADVPVVVPRYEIPGGSVAGLTGAGGNVFYVFDMPDA